MFLPARQQGGGYLTRLAQRYVQVEIYLQDVLDSQRKTLGNTLKRSIGRYPNQARVEWLMDADPPGSAKKSDPAQVGQEGLSCISCGVGSFQLVPRIVVYRDDILVYKVQRVPRF